MLNIFLLFSLYFFGCFEASEKLKLRRKPDEIVTEVVRYDGRKIPFENQPQKFYYKTKKKTKTSTFAGELMKLRSTELLQMKLRSIELLQVNISNPSVEIKVKCAHCNAERCRPLPFCYSIQYSQHVRSTGDYCADESEMFSLVGAQLDATTSSQRKRRRLHESCLPSINDATLHYCVCQTFDDDASSREYDALRRIRVWRYQSLIFHDEVEQRRTSGTSSFNGYLMVLMVFWRFI